MVFKVLLPNGRVRNFSGKWEGKDSPVGWRALVRLSGKGTTGVVVGVSEEKAEGEIVSFPDGAPLLTQVQLSLVEDLSYDYLIPKGVLLFKLLPSAFLWKEEELVRVGVDSSVGLDRDTARLVEYVKKKKGVKLDSLRKKFGPGTVKVLLKKGILRLQKEWVFPPLEVKYYRLAVGLKEALSKLRSESKRRLAVFMSGRDWVSEEEVLSWGFSRKDITYLVKRGILEAGSEYAGAVGGAKGMHFLPLKKSLGGRVILWDRLGEVAEKVLPMVVSNLERGKSVLILLSELSGLGEISETLNRYVGDRLAEIHSGVPPKTIVKNWFNTREGPRVVIGSYMASLCPFEDLGLIVLMGESSPGVKLRAVGGVDLRRLAFLLSRRTSSELVMGTQVPTLSSYLLVKEGKAKLEGPPEDLPQIEVVKREATELFTQELYSELKDEGGSILFLVPKQGYSYVYCPRCESVVQCPECGIFLTYSRKKEVLYCTGCPYRSEELLCPECEGELEEIGFGVEKAMEVVEKALGMREGFHFSTQPPWNASFDTVVVLSADSILSVPSYRAKEELFLYLCKAMLCARNTLIVQTLFPEEEVFTLLKEKDFFEFYSRELEERRREHLPPFWRLLLIRSRREEVAGYVFKNISPRVRTTFNPREGTYDILVRFRDRGVLRKVKALLRRFGKDIIEVKTDPF